MKVKVIAGEANKLEEQLTRFINVEKPACMTSVTQSSATLEIGTQSHVMTVITIFYETA
jgi:hypothetical protein